MAREHARILTSIWSDQEFRARTRDEQWLFFRVLSDRHINNAGVLPLWESKWARAAADASMDDVEKARRGLVASRFLVVDEDTDEALVRSFLRGDRVYRQPNVLKNALGEAPATESPALRLELAVELRRIIPMLPTGKGFEGMPEEVWRTVAVLDPMGSTQRDYEGMSNPSVGVGKQPIRNPSEATGPKATASRGVGEGAGVGDGASPSGGDRVGGSRARTTPARPAAASASGGPPPLPSELDEEPRSAASAAPPAATWPVQPCGDRHDPERPCRRCGAARRSGQDQADQATLAEAARRADARRRIDRCGACNESGWLEHPETRDPVVKCDHETDPRQQIADALDQAS